MLSKRNIKARLKFVREHVDKHQDIWNNVIWIEESKIELFGQQNRGCIWRKKEKNLIQIVKHGGGSVMVWGCFAAVGPAHHRIHHEFYCVSEGA